MFPAGFILLLLKEAEDDKNESDNRSLEETLDDLERSSSFDMWVSIGALVGLLLGIGFSLFITLLLG